VNLPLQINFQGQQLKFGRMFAASAIEEAASKKQLCDDPAVGQTVPQTMQKGVAWNEARLSQVLSKGTDLHHNSPSS